MSGRKFTRLVVALTTMLALAATSLMPGATLTAERASAQTPFTLEEVASGFDRPILVTNAGDDSGRLFVMEQSGKIRIIQDGAVLDVPFLDVSDLITPSALTGDYTEQGLLGLAFHPDFAQNGTFFIDYTDREGSSVVARNRVSANDPNTADAASAESLLVVPQPSPTHNGGHLAFGPDGYLYVALGDGGPGGDPNGNGQNPRTLLGSVLRLDVNAETGYAVPPDNPFANSDAGRPEIWAYGLRNPWRFSFDRETGDLYIADVGQNEWEEVNFQPADSPGGENYGWNAYEGTHIYSGQQPTSDVVMPIAEYSHSTGGCSITGGFVYRGAAVAALQGTYFYGDWCSGTLWAATPDGSGAWNASPALETGRAISSFGEDEAGELYLVDYAGAVLRFAPAS